jgi:hypothetical protein
MSVTGARSITLRRALLISISALFTAPLAAHHSFAVYDFQNEIEFDGVVETLNFKNPHLAMTLAVTHEDGSSEIIEFVEGAPANMLIRMGFDPKWIAPGTRIRAIGSPRRDDPKRLFMKSMILEDGREFRVVN